MATKIRQNGTKNIDYTPGSNVSAGDVVVLGEMVCYAITDILSGNKGALATDAVVRLPKLSTDVVASAGVVLYWDAGNTRLTTTASTHKKAGLAFEAAGSGVSEIDVLLVPGLTT